MAKQATFVLALVFFSAVISMALASASTSAPSTAPSAGEMASSEGPSPLDFSEGPNAYDNVIGTVSGEATDAAPVGGPVSDSVFPDLAPVPGPGSGVAGLGATTIVGAIAVAGVVESFFLY